MSAEKESRLTQLNQHINNHKKEISINEGYLMSALTARKKIGTLSTINGELSTPEKSSPGAVYGLNSSQKSGESASENSNERVSEYVKHSMMLRDTLE